MPNSTKLRFPRVTSVELSNFSLYTLAPSVKLEIPNGVFCLVGANGIGKSTFLAALNFGLCGSLRNPEREFTSFPEHVKFAEKYAKDFFDGRISEEDRDLATVGIEFEIGDQHFSICRGIFDERELRELTIRDIPSGEITYDGSEETELEKYERYKLELKSAVGLENFDQFVFLQHYVLTFDENRNLLFWDKLAIERALYICVGADFKKAEEADALRREKDKADSLARNYNYHASNVRKRLEGLKEAIEFSGRENQEDIEDLREAHKNLQGQLDGLHSRIAELNNEIHDCQLKHSRYSSELASLEAEYRDRFNAHLNQSSVVEYHPIIKSTISSGECAICGSHHSKVKTIIEERVKEGECPLCLSALQTEDNLDAMAALKDLDSRISEVKNKLKSVFDRQRRISSEKDILDDRAHAARESLRGFENKNEAALRSENLSSNALSGSMQALKRELDHQLALKERKYEERNRIHKRIVAIQKSISRSYEKAEVEFVPLFRRIAYTFLGMDLDVSLSSGTGVSDSHLGLLLEVKGAQRRALYQLSESQRFFMDIALRMAMAQYISDSGSPATMLIDTPEGSLDIAYESRAGDMFAKFSQENHPVIMTANVNSSNLLRRLAARCGRSGMAIHRMTEWNELSGVQLEEEDLFFEAYRRIESAFEEGLNS